MESLKQIQVLCGHSDRVWCVSWNTEGNLLASCSGDKKVKIWAYSSSTLIWECVHTISDQHNRTIRCVAWSPCGTLLASAGFDGVVCLWRVESHQPFTIDPLTDLASHNYEVKSVAFSASGSKLATCARDKTVQVWDIDDDDNCEYSAVLSSHTEDVKCVCWHPSLDILVSGSYDNNIKVYKDNFDDWEVVASLAGHTSTVWKTEFNSAGDILASCSDDRSVRLWVTQDVSFTKWMCASVIEGYHERVIYDISWTPSLNILVSVSGDNRVCVYRVGEMHNSVVNGDVGGSDGSGIEVELLTRVHQAHDEDINCCSWRLGIRHEAMILATGSDDCSIKLWRFTDPDLTID